MVNRWSVRFKARLGPPWPALAWFGPVRQDQVGHGLVWHGMVLKGSEFLAGIRG